MRPNAVADQNEEDVGEKKKKRNDERKWYNPMNDLFAYTL